MRQRVMIAIAWRPSPMLLIADEPTTALDVTIQAQILELLRRLSEELEVAVMMITHDLGCGGGVLRPGPGDVRGSDRRAGLAERPLHRPAPPVHAGPARSSPRLDVVSERLDSIAGDPPEHANAVSGCPFHPRCPEALDVCVEEEPQLLGWQSERRWVACWRREEEARA